MRCSLEILRRWPDGSTERINRYSFDGVSPDQIVEMAAIELRASEAAWGANAVAIYDQSAQKLMEWTSGAHAW